MDAQALNAITRVLAHREAFHKEQFLEDRGYEVLEGQLISDGYRCPNTGEVLDLETAYAYEQVREIAGGLA